MSKASPAASSRVVPSTRNPRVVLDVEQQRVAAAGEQAQERRLGGIGLEEERGDVTVQVVDRDERQPPRPGERLRRRETDEERADQAGPAGDRDPRDVVERLRSASARASRTTGTTSSRCRRDATSGTTPP